MRKRAPASPSPLYCSKMPRKRPPQLPCKGCGAVITGYRRLFCTLDCGDRYRSKIKAQHQLKARVAARAVKRPCGNPVCDNTFTGNLQRKFCSSRCNQIVNHKRPTLEWERQSRARRTEKNVASAPACSICSRTTARNSYYRSTSLALAMIPGGINLCKSHFRGYASFIKQNKLASQDRDDVFNAYLVRLTFVSSTRQSYIVMMREAFHSGAGVLT